MFILTKSLNLSEHECSTNIIKSNLYTLTFLVTNLCIHILCFNAFFSCIIFPFLQPKTKQRIRTRSYFLLPFSIQRMILHNSYDTATESILLVFQIFLCLIFEGISLQGGDLGVIKGLSIDHLEFRLN